MEARLWQQERQAKDRLVLAYSIAALASQAFAGKLQSLDSLLGSKPVQPTISDDELARLEKFRSKIQTLKKQKKQQACRKT